MTEQQTFLRFWVFATALFFLSLWLFKSILLPFVLGVAIAYLLNPPVVKLRAMGCPRSVSALLMLLVFFVIAGALIAVSIPVIHDQLTQLANALPDLIANLQNKLQPYIDQAQTLIRENGGQEQIKSNVGGTLGGAVKWLGGVLGKLVSGGMAIFDFLSVAVITPVVAFYMMRDWPDMVKKVDGWLPRKQAGTIRGLLGKIDDSVSGFVRGQLSVAFILGVFYALALTVLGLKFGFVIGLMAGLLSIIPYIGSIIGLVSALGVAFYQYDGLTYPVIVAAIFFFGQMVEGNFLTPKLVGDRIGLHPVWVIFALMAGGALGGFVGMLVALPVAAVAGVMIRFGLEQYLDSPYYKAAAKKKPAKRSRKKTA